MSTEGRRSAIARTLLKQVWLEKVEKARGSMSLLRLNTQHPDRQLLDRFMNNGPDQVVEHEGTADWLEDTLIQRREEFQRWTRDLTAHLEKRVEVQRAQLRQQVHQLQLHARWLKPLLHQDRGAATRNNPSLVDAFNTSVFRLLLLARHTGSLEERIERGDLPGFIRNPKLRHYHPVLILELNFRATRPKTLGIRGRVEVRITGYGLSTGEIENLRREVERFELEEALLSLDASHSDIVALANELMENSVSERRPLTTKPTSGETNPFSALISALVQAWIWLTRKFKTGADGSRSDSHAERILRHLAVEDARQLCDQTFRGLKQHHV